MAKKYLTLSAPARAPVITAPGPECAVTTPNNSSLAPVVIPGQAQAEDGPPPIFIDNGSGASQERGAGLAGLARLILIGRQYHEAAGPGAFVEKIYQGYYGYERHTVYKTCAIAAAYAGAFGPKSIERPAFSYSQAVYTLSLLLNFDLKQTVTDPAGGRGPLVVRIIKLTDVHYWDTAGIVAWLFDMARSAAGNL